MSTTDTAGPGEVLRVEEIYSRYPSEWILVGDPETDRCLHVLSGRVLWHSKDRDELYRKGRELRPRHSAILYTGSTAPAEGEAFVL
jgi:hypothetical protein